VIVIKAILFDMDGVLIDARDWHYEALNRALDLFGMALDRDTHLSSFDGLPTRRKLEMLQLSRGLPRQLHDFINRLKQNYTAEIVYARCRPVFQHRFALSRLQQKGYKMAVCSNSVRASVNLMMSLSQLAEYLDLQMSNEDVARSKPDPEIYLTTMQRLEVEPQQCIIVEDNEHGIQAAGSSGGHVLVVGSPIDVTYDRIMQAIDRAEGSRA
jgi:beta-phosphoglucomutase-like phosphatase (HAD superfamily)